MSLFFLSFSVILSSVPLLPCLCITLSICHSVPPLLLCLSFVFSCLYVILSKNNYVILSKNTIFAVIMAVFILEIIV